MRNLVVDSGSLLPGSATISQSTGAIKMAGGVHHAAENHGLFLWSSSSGMKARLISP